MIPEIQDIVIHGLTAPQMPVRSVREPEPVREPQPVSVITSDAVYVVPGSTRVNDIPVHSEMIHCWTFHFIVRRVNPKQLSEEVLGPEVEEE